MFNRCPCAWQRSLVGPSDHCRLPLFSSVAQTFGLNLHPSKIIKISSLSWSEPGENHMNYLMSHRKIQHCARMPHFPVFQGDDRDLSSKRPLNTIKHTFTPKSVLNVSWLLQGPCFCQGVLGSSKKNRTLRRQGSTRHKMLCLETSFFSTTSVWQWIPFFKIILGIA